MPENNSSPNTICKTKKNKRHNGYWTKERSIKEASKFITIQHFYRKSRIAYDKCKELGLENEAFSHMIKLEKETKWSDPEKCIAQAKQYKDKKEFYNNSRRAYDNCIKFNLEKEAFSHMGNIGVDYGNKIKKCLYLIYYENVRYVGITSDLQRRERKHRLTRKDINSNFKVRKLTDYIDIDSAINNEKRVIELYKRKTKYKLLNKSCGGETGSLEKTYSKKTCLEVASLYSSLYEMHVGNNTAYRALCEYYSEEERAKIFGKNLVRWTHEECVKESSKYMTRSEFAKASGSAYRSTIRNNWQKTCFMHMNSVYLPRGYWSEDKIRASALLCSTRYEFFSRFQSAYTSASKSGILKEVTSHMPKKAKANSTIYKRR